MRQLALLLFTATLLLIGCGEGLLAGGGPERVASALSASQALLPDGSASSHPVWAHAERTGKAPSARRTQPLTRSEARTLARTLGYNETSDAPFNAHGQPVFKSGNKYITPDKDVHKGGTWKMFDGKGKRLGTYNDDLTKKLGD